MCAGYYKKPHETRAAIHPLACDQEGPDWLFTGDLARRDIDGCFYIVGRSKDMFISGGENVFPSEIESVLHAHPCVAEAAVIAVPHSKWGEVGRAIIVCKPGTELDAESLLDYLRDNLARYKLPKSVIFVESLPKTGANKVDKVRLIHLYG
jgi:fatty-acyl-CoA synthase